MAVWGYGREICGNLAIAETREWLVTNGIGGYACGTVPGLLTRHYHGLLMAALSPPLGQTLMLVKLDETAQYRGQTVALATNRWADGTVAPAGYLQLERFYLQETIPVWEYAIADARLSKRVWMESGRNITYIRYCLDRAQAPLHLSLAAIVNYRDRHGGSITGTWDVAPKSNGVTVEAFAGAVPLRLLGTGNWTRRSQWNHRYDLALERYRGTGECEDHLHAATLEVTLQPGEAVTVVATAEAAVEDIAGEAALQRRLAAEEQRRDRFVAQFGKSDWLEQLALAANAFLCRREAFGNRNRTLANPDSKATPGKTTPGKTILAGYPWFGDWGRDAAISLVGLTVGTGQSELARPILRTFARYCDRGMLPNLFPDDNRDPVYNTIDAVWWYFEAVRAYFQATGDKGLLVELFPTLATAIDWHVRGTRYNIHLDDDGLLYGGEPTEQLTWMDAKVGNWVVTPRQGKAVEVNALWHSALCTMVQFARVAGKPEREYERRAERARRGFERFWYAAGGYCYDVVDSPQGDDATLRPNQIFAVSLPHELLSRDRAQSVVDVVGRKLVTSYGLRSLDPDDPRYCGRYGGDRWQRDGAYHQGTVWTWLLGAYAEAHFRTYGDAVQARSFLEPLRDTLLSGAVGTLSEIFDGDEPHHPRGCFAQAWSVAEVLRVMGKLG